MKYDIYYKTTSPNAHTVSVEISPPLSAEAAAGVCELLASIDGIVAADITRSDEAGTLILSRPLYDNPPPERGKQTAHLISKLINPLGRVTVEMHLTDPA